MFTEEAKLSQRSISRKNVLQPLSSVPALSSDPGTIIISLITWNERSATWTMVIVAVDEDPALAEDLTAWAKRYWSAIHAHTNNGGYVNFMMGDGDPARLKATYGENYERLVALKRKYDPTNFLHMNQNIPVGSTP